MKPQKFTSEFAIIFGTAVQLAKAVEVSALLVLLDGPTDWEQLKERADGELVIVAADDAEQLDGAAETGLSTVMLEMQQSAVHDKLGQAVLEAVADEFLEPGARVVALYSGFEAGTIDSLSVIDLGDHLGRLTVRDLRQLETRVPLDTLQSVVNLALEIGREGREGKPVGTLFVVGDAAKVRKLSYTLGFDPMKGYARKDRNLKSPKVREGVKEVAQLDGAILVSSDGTVEAACQYIDASAAAITLTKGLGARHWAAAAVSRATKAVAVAVSESNGTVRIFQNGEVILRIEPFRRPLKWKEFEYEPPAAE